jgi:hypothetical protein
LQNFVDNKRLAPKLGATAYHMPASRLAHAKRGDGQAALLL